MDSHTARCPFILFPFISFIPQVSWDGLPLFSAVPNSYLQRTKCRKGTHHCIAAQRVTGYAWQINLDNLTVCMKIGWNLNPDECDCSADVIPAATNGQVESVTENRHPSLDALHEERHYMDCNGQLPTCSITFISSNDICVSLQLNFNIY